ncbi:PITH domain-containing protein At3g04780-like [Amborella trichopoda]|uniref:PITH domain-containing protein At3g04780-like n=1 Tax=Amborella trichopoda TaxID=13333 RepID=UPI0009BD37A0|nr:PITH domain-containing protein At3g04780-like [Amborella trichopoda]|eukprot:XP_020520070.1 PITH domain-containing protein At3g04780-like [Amborella trichopoda]
MDINLNGIFLIEMYGKPVTLKYVKFQNVRSLTIFIEDNQSGADLTKVQKIALFGTTVETTDMKRLEKDGGSLVSILSYVKTYFI